jgi:hypothetical protein
MIVTRKYIRDLRGKYFWEISADMEKLILEKFGKEPGPADDGCSYSYTEQDILEQIRKMIRDQK